MLRLLLCLLALLLPLLSDDLIVVGAGGVVLILDGLPVDAEEGQAADYYGTALPQQRTC
jgi:hypothetical protein